MYPMRVCLQPKIIARRHHLRWLDFDRAISKMIKDTLAAMEKDGRCKAIDWMEFRDIESFNNAMFAKQVSRLVHELDSLVAQVLKSKFFKKGKVLRLK